MTISTLATTLAAPAVCEAPPIAAQAIQDGGALRLGGLSPIFHPASIADAGKLRLGGLSPIFQAR